MLAKPRNTLLNWLLSALCVSAALMTSPAAQAANELFIGGGGGQFAFAPATKTFGSRKFTEVVHQKYDFSCGSAAVATLLTYHYGHPIKEKDVLDAMFVRGDQAKIKREGFSLLDMKQYLHAIGYQAEGFRESLTKLETVGIPAIVLINRKGYLHFVVIKGVTKEKVSVGDSTLGITLYDRDEFEKMWNGILFVITDSMRIGRTGFNTEMAWNPYGRPEFSGMLDTGQLSGISLSNAYMFNYY